MMISISIEDYRAIVEARDEAIERVSELIQDLKVVNRSRSAYKGVNTRLKNEVARLKADLEALTPQVEQPQVEQPQVEPTPQVEQPQVEPTPQVEQPQVEQPQVEPTPQVEQPQVEQPRVEQPQVEQEEGYDCVICMENIEEGDHSQLECGHRFHITCIDRWTEVNPTCPTCRHRLPSAPPLPSNIHNVLWTRRFNRRTGLLTSHVDLDMYTMVNYDGGPTIYIEEYNKPQTLETYDVIAPDVYRSRRRNVILYTSTARGTIATLSLR
jgi:hypothetical protein